LIKLGRAQGVAIAAALSRNVPVYEYAPLKIKQSITGHGRATKEQMWAMLARILSLDGAVTPHYLDASDALGAAVCHCLQFGVNGAVRATSVTAGITRTSKKKTSWQQFIIANSNRIIKK
jgi:crossover junction endodeoxyribonuclease RuvC